ncbi:MAG: SDR family oxidoreductase [Myxococcota bacterium]
MRDGGRIVCLVHRGDRRQLRTDELRRVEAGIIGYVEALSTTVAKRGITVNAIAPGFIETRLTDAIPPINREVIRRMSNLSQGGLPQDIAEVVTFLASPGSVGVTGSVIRVCGGNYVGA